MCLRPVLQRSQPSTDAPFLHGARLALAYPCLMRDGNSPFSRRPSPNVSSTASIRAQRFLRLCECTTNLVVDVQNSR